MAIGGDGVNLERSRPKVRGSKPRPEYPRRRMADFFGVATGVPAQEAFAEMLFLNLEGPDGRPR
jgi:hypothetical protein